MNYVLLSVIATLLLLALLFFEKKNHISGKLLAKTPLSLLFIWLAINENSASTDYYYFILTGLVFSLFGDVLLALPQRKAFLAGLVSFLLGHVAYVVGFFSIAQFSPSALIPAAASIVISLLAFRWLKPHLGNMIAPVIAYVVVITFMVIGASCILTDSNLPENAQWVIFIGAVLFYFSDLFVARNRFVIDEHINRIFGLPTYYGGQFMLAYSVGML